MTQPSSLYQTLHATASAYVQSYDIASELRDVSQVSSTLTKDCLRSYRPVSWTKQLPGLQHPSTNAKYEEAVKLQVEQAFDCITRTVETTIDEVQRKAVVHVETYLFPMGQKPRAEWKIGEERFMVEFVFTLFMDDEGRKVKNICQFIDALGVKSVMEGDAAVGKMLKDTVG